MDPIYFTTDLDYAFGSGSGFNPETYNNLTKPKKQTTTASAATSTKKTKKSKASRLNYDGMTFDDAFSAARRAGKRTFNWRGKEYTTELAPSEQITPPSLEAEPLVERSRIGGTHDLGWTPAIAAASYGADAGLRRMAMAPPAIQPIGYYPNGGPYEQPGYPY